MHCLAATALDFVLIEGAAAVQIGRMDVVLIRQRDHPVVAVAVECFVPVRQIIHHQSAVSDSQITLRLVADSAADFVVYFDRVHRKAQYFAGSVAYFGPDHQTILLFVVVGSA